MNQAVFCGRESDLDYLKEAWRIVTEENKPQLVTLLAESGLGKTRLVQEFYALLAQSYRSNQGMGYWPSRISQNDQNLLVNPDISDVDSERHMPFLWWGLRLIDPTGRNQVTSSAVSTYLKALTPHLEHVYRARRRQERRYEGTKVATSTVVGLVPGVGGITSVSHGLSELEKIRRDGSNDTLLSPQQADQKNLQDMNERILTDLSQLFSDRENNIPMVWIIDDAHFSTTDSSVVDLFITVIQTAQHNDWPLLIIVTHRKKEWNEQFTSDAPPNIANSIKGNYQSIHSDWQPYALTSLRDDVLSPVLEIGLPGLTINQAAELLKRADGNPRFLEEIVKFCREHPKHFENKKISNSLTAEGLKEVLNESTDLYRLVKKRLRDLPPEVRTIITLSSLQGIRSLHLVSQHLIEQLISDGHELNGSQHREVWQLAQNPYAFVNIFSQHLAEFNERVFYEVAKENVANIINEAEARKSLGQVLKDLTQSGRCENLSDDEMERFIEITADTLAYSDEPKDRQMALNCYADLTKIALERYDYKAALQICEGILEKTALQEGQKVVWWQLESLSFGQLKYIFEAFWRMRQLNDALFISIVMKAVAEDWCDMRERSTSSIYMGDVLRAMGNLKNALHEYQISLEIDRKLNEISQSFDSKFNLSLSYGRVGHIHHRKAMMQMDVARKVYQKGEGNSQKFNKIHKEIIEELNYALRNYQIMFSIRKEVYKAQPEQERTPKLKLDLSIAYEKVGDVLLDIGQVQVNEAQLDAALESFESSFRIREVLLKTLRTPPLVRALSLSYNRRGDTYKAKGDLGSALENYQEGLNLAKELAEALQTPESKRDLSVSYYRCTTCAEIFEEQGRIPELRQILTDGLSSIQDYREVASYENVESVILYFRRKLEELNQR